MTVGPCVWMNDKNTFHIKGGARILERGALWTFSSTCPAGICSFRLFCRLKGGHPPYLIRVLPAVPLPVWACHFSTGSGACSTRLPSAVWSSLRSHCSANPAERQQDDRPEYALLGLLSRETLPIRGWLLLVTDDALASLQHALLSRPWRMLMLDVWHFVRLQNKRIKEISITI